ncbi:hypothetical protein GCM10009756_28980 [Pseudokineococcus marinus]|uniref:iron-sulfur cluster-binding protein n=1 Tax=Pseudokineococcus marinus TaxID=351215 RepID=UPI0031CF4CDC
MTAAGPVDGAVGGAETGAEVVDDEAVAPPGAVAERAVVRSAEPVGAYTRLVLAAPRSAAAARPGQFAACSTGDSGMLLRRSFSISSADAATGELVLVVAAAGPGTARIAALRAGDVLPVLAPLGRPFALPPAGDGVVLVGGGYGAAPLAWLGAALRARGSAVDLVVGAGDARRLLGHDTPSTAGKADGVPWDADAPVDRVHVATEDGSAGARGRVTDLLPDLLAGPAGSAGRGGGAQHVLACGPMAMLRAVHEVASAAGATTQLATEESMACGIGVCMTCVLPVVGDDGRTRMVRACTEGPVFPGERLRWDAIGAPAPQRPAGVGARVLDDAGGAPAPASTPPPASAGGGATAPGVVGGRP